jgi:murein L,D-transpeptidase YcbB/YkuD
VVGPNTLSVLNVPVEDRIRTILVNMERWRWLPLDLEDEYLMVDIANYLLYAVENDREALKMRVVVGKPFWSTPVFNGAMTHLVFNPYWNVPLSIALKETLPEALKDPAYLEENRIRMVKGWGPKAKILDPADVELTREALLRADYRFRQDSGPGNALGRIKFMFPNRFHVYLHDTPAKSLFQLPNRSFSHGCIRVEEPVKLANYLLRKDAKWSSEAILRQLDSLERKSAPLPEPLAVHILYWTAWADENGLMRFRNDVYERDDAVYNALFEEPLRP